MYVFKKQTLLTVGFLLTLSACGGGGGSTTGGGGSSTALTDTTALTVSSTTPVDSATSVARDSTITATFNEDVFATTTDAASFTLAKSGAIDGTVTFEASTNVATYTPGSELARLATYTATLSTAITDLSGNPLAADYSWSFTTADGAWRTAELIEFNNTELYEDADSPQVAFDSSGNAIAVWFQTDGDRYNIWANRFQ